jgi:hypothetical protein
MNAILMDLQAKQPKQGPTLQPMRSEFSVFDWRVIRRTLLEDAEQLVANVESIYHFAYQYFKGDSVLHARHFDSVLLNISSSAEDLEGSCLLAALWMGHLTWNANGHLLASFLGMTRSIKRLLGIILSEEETEETKGTLLQRKGKFLLAKLQAVVRMKVRPLKNTNIHFAMELKREAKVFVSSVHDFLNTVEKTDGTLLHRQPHKISSEVTLLLHHYERLNGVIFPVQTQFQFQFYPTVGRNSTNVRLSRSPPAPGVQQGYYGYEQNGYSQTHAPLLDTIDIGTVPTTPAVFATNSDEKGDFVGTPLKDAAKDVVLSDQTLNGNSRSVDGPESPKQHTTRDTLPGSDVKPKNDEQQQSFVVAAELRRAETVLRESTYSKKSFRVYAIDIDLLRVESFPSKCVHIARKAFGINW